MSPQESEFVGKCVGLLGMFLGTCLLVYRKRLTKKIFPNLPKEQAYRLSRPIVITVWVIGLVGIGAWIRYSAVVDEQQGNPASVIKFDTSVGHVDECKYSFHREKLISPLIVMDIDGGPAATGEHVTAVNLADSEKSNRYDGEIKTRTVEGSEHPIVYCEDRDPEYPSSYSYQYLGTSESGIHIIRTWDCGGGSGIFCHLMFFEFKIDQSVDYDVDAQRLVKKQRLNLKSRGKIILGDRYDGEIEYADGVLRIGKDQGSHSCIYTEDVYIRLE